MTAIRELWASLAAKVPCHELGRQLDLGRPTVAEILRSNAPPRCPNCGSRMREMLYDIPVCANCGAKLE